MGAAGVDVRARDPSAARRTVADPGDYGLRRRDSRGVTTLPDSLNSDGTAARGRWRTNPGGRGGPARKGSADGRPAWVHGQAGPPLEGAREAGRPQHVRPPSRAVPPLPLPGVRLSPRRTPGAHGDAHADPHGCRRRARTGARPVAPHHPRSCHSCLSRLFGSVGGLSGTVVAAFGSFVCLERASRQTADCRQPRRAIRGRLRGRICSVAPTHADRRCAASGGSGQWRTRWVTRTRAGSRMGDQRRGHRAAPGHAASRPVGVRFAVARRAAIRPRWWRRAAPRVAP